MVIPRKACGGVQDRKYKVLILPCVSNATTSLRYSGMSQCDTSASATGGPEKEGYELTV